MTSKTTASDPEDIAETLVECEGQGIRIYPVDSEVTVQTQPDDG